MTMFFFAKITQKVFVITYQVNFSQFRDNCPCDFYLNKAKSFNGALSPVPWPLAVYNSGLRSIGKL